MGNAYWPSHWPILKMVLPVCTDPEIFLVVVEPALTETEVEATLYSPW